MKKTAELLQELLKNGLSFRYQPERFSALKGGGHPYPSPTRLVDTPDGQMIEEVVQPILTPVCLSLKQHHILTQLAAAWPLFLRVQLSLYRKAKQGELDPADCVLIQSMCTAQEWELGVTDPGYNVIHPFIRLDAMLVGDEFKVIDINSTRPAGVGDLVAYNSVMNSYLDSELQNYPVNTAFANIVSQCVDQWAGKRNLPGESIPVQIVIRDSDGDWRNFENLNKVLIGAGLNSSLIIPDQLNGGDATALIRGRIKEGDPAYALLQKHYPDNRCILSPLYRRFLGNKLWMYLLRLEPFAAEFRAQLEDAYQLFDNAFPEVGVVENEMLALPDDTRRAIHTLDRAEWVFKDPASSSGRRMLLGLTMGKKKWLTALDQVQDGWIAQRFYRVSDTFTVTGPEGEPIERKLFTKYGIYIFGSELAGLEFNAREFPVVHGARNTYFNSVQYRMN